MAANDLLESMLRICVGKVSEKEKLLLEIIFFKYLYAQLKKTIESIECKQTEEAMLDGSVIRILINDLLISGEYSLQGLANYTDYSEDVLYDIAAGINNQPTLSLATKIIELHALARQEFYSFLVNKTIKQVILHGSSENNDSNWII